MFLIITSKLNSTSKVPKPTTNSRIVLLLRQKIDSGILNRDEDPDPIEVWAFEPVLKKHQNITSSLITIKCDRYFGR